MTKICACILIFNSTFLQSDPEILYAANTILTHLSFFFTIIITLLYVIQKNQLHDWIVQSICQ